jgi:hypothetical protein
MIAVTVAIICVFGRNAWEHTEVLDERKVFAQEVFGTLRAKLPGYAHNGVEQGNGDGTATLRSRARAHEDKSAK